MNETNYNGNLFLLPAGRKDAGVVTTNGIVRKNGRLVMGAGIAKYCRDTHKGIDLKLGGMVSQEGNQAFFAGRYADANRKVAGLEQMVNVISMPTKNNWQDPSDLDLIARSCQEMMDLADEFEFQNIYLPAPGCSNGGLDYLSQVRPIILPLLDDRFTVCLPDSIWNSI